MARRSGRGYAVRLRNFVTVRVDKGKAEVVCISVYRRKAHEEGTAI